MDRTVLRPGQAGAIDEATKRILAGETFTAIILPTRYGKSHVFRILATELFQAGVICCTLVLSPTEYLRDQMADPKKFEECIRMFDLRNEGIRIGTVTGRLYDLAANGEVFLSTTIQLFEQNVQTFSDWAEEMEHRTGRPVLIVVDESHTGSEMNQWGGAVNAIARVGTTKVIVATATAVRSDGQWIPGFERELLAEGPVQIVKTRPGSKAELIWVDIYDAMQRHYRLKGHHETTFGEAWQESPSPLCKISRVPFDVDMKRISGAGEEFPDPVKLSELSSTNVRKWLGPVVRENVVIDHACRRGLQAMANLRHCQSDAAMIVFCGNDKDSDARTNAHADAIARAIQHHDRRLRCVIATSAEKSGKTKIENFVKGVGDVLIVKQMASLGLDAPRIKVVVDLSPVRTPAAFIQRLMRGATPHGPLRVMSYVVPAEIIGQALWQEMILDTGGVATAQDLELVESYETEKKDPSQRDLFHVQGTDDADFQDTAGNEADAKYQPVSWRFLSVFPEMNEKLSHAEVVRRWHGMDAPEVDVRDSSYEQKMLRADCVDAANEITRALMPAQYDSGTYGRLIAAVWRKAYDECDVPEGVELDQISSIATLTQIKEALKKRCADYARS